MKIIMLSVVLILTGCGSLPDSKLCKDGIVYSEYAQSFILSGAVAGSAVVVKCKF